MPHCFCIDQSFCSISNNEFTLGKNTATLGQSLFDVRYAANAGDGGLSHINLKARTVLALIYVASPWLQERLYDILSLIGDQQSISDKASSCAKWIEKVWRLASIVNLMVFLQNGTYPSLVERLLGLQHVYNKPQSIQKASFTFMNREILWHGYAEFIFFVLPLIKMYGLKNLVRRFFGHSSNVPSLEGANQTSSLSKYCPVCNQLPTQPYVANCGHHFCYYCIKVSCMEDPSFVCPLCNVATSKVLPHQLSI
ncbi:peroxisome biogenesis factor 2-like isoform X2 [Rhopilema esculentum]|uniref:peroxisome biogenesis factor 2-like isoform X2 n=1 Tax=Rhopilema esculentum TaxID=499914 RepID=UPI0031DD9918